MRKMKQLLTLLVFTISIAVGYSQANSDCSIKYNLFKGDYSAKKYDAAYENWMWCMDNCPTLSVNIYKYGKTIAMHRWENAPTGEKAAAAKVVERVFEQRLQHYKKDFGKVYNDWANWKKTIGAPESEVFELLEKAFKADPASMSPKNIFAYFDIIMQNNKDNNPQLVFDTYDEVGEGLELKRAEYSKKIETINKKDSTTLSSKDKKNRVTYQKIMLGLNQVEGGLDGKISSISTCENLIPLNKKYFEEKKNDKVWLKRAVSRMYNKECTEDPFYVTLVEAYVNADPTPESYVFYAGILMERGEDSKAMDHFKKAVELETDSYKKAQNLLRIAQILGKKGRYSEARSYCNLALDEVPTMGRAYLLIAGMYAKTANKCGTDVLSKRMVYVAALNKAQTAKRVDPSISSMANKFIRSYRNNIPSKKDLFTADPPVNAGDAFTVKCWINERVKVQTRD